LPFLIFVTVDLLLRLVAMAMTIAPLHFLRNVSRNVVEASINPDHDGAYEHKKPACHQPPTPSGTPARHLFLRGLHGAVDVALACLYVILGHHL
jgi:hypothetical protein